VVDLVVYFIALPAIQLDRGAGQAPVGAAGDRQDDLQVTQQLGDCADRRRGGLARPLRFQEQLRLFQNPLAEGGARAAPSRVQLPGFAAGEVVPSDRIRHAHAVLGVGARHRHQMLHRDMGREGAVPHLLLYAGRQQLDQGQPARYPTQAAIKAARQLIQAIAEALLQLRQQPAFFQRGHAVRHAERTIQHQRLGFAQRPGHRFHRVSPQLLQGGDALVAVDHQVTVRLVGDRHHNDGRLLSSRGQRGQQPALSLRPPHPQVLPAPLQLVKLQSHRRLPRCCSYRGWPGRTP
jgi:hypothetical protein